MKKKLALAAVVMAAAGLITAGIAPAQATGAPTLPDGQHFFAGACDAIMPQLTSVETTTGNATYVGNANNNECPSNAAVNPVDGVVYMLYFTYNPFVKNLAKVDPATGVYTVIAPITGISGSVFGFSITKDGSGYFKNSSHLWSLDLTSGIATAVGTDLGLNPDMMGYNPVDDTLYAFEYDSNSTTLLTYTVDTSSGVATADPAHNITMADYSIDTNTGCNLNSLEGVAFDGNGNPWFVSDSCLSAELVVADFATGAATFVALITNSTINPDSPHDFYTESIFITGTPTPAALPDTGASAIALVSTGAIAAGLLGAGVLALITVRRRQAGK
jgi:hypothetical protein